ncbi:MAG: hybrid sensor histidine kinase/response regulator, partial [Alphaproteobacteria bacterium]|nr:hybrid sensor histidine kinase/response regulator [Alphaproteobacteria bacterium]
VFEEFRRLDDTEESVDEMPGLGLGLAIVERIGRMLGHDIGVRSRLGRGSVFSVSLPLTAKPAAALPVRPSIAAAADRLAGLRILCVDNDRQILAGVKALLEEWGCRISVAADLDRTLAVVAADGPPDVVLIDHHLGEGQTGFAVLDRLTEVGVKAPAILITADHGDALRDAARARGVPLLNKPVKPAVLRSLMSQLLATSRRAAAE